MNNSLRIISGAFLFLFYCGHASADQSVIFSPFVSFSDTLPPSQKYQGYRLNIQSIRKVKESNDWFKISFTSINTGRQDIDFSKPGVAHWVNFIFDQSLRESGLGAMVEQMKQALVDQQFKLKVGKIAKKQSLKVSKHFPEVVQNESAGKPSSTEKKTEGFVFTARESTQMSQEDLLKRKNECPDLLIEEVKVLNQSKKWIELEYTIANIGKGPVAIYGGEDEMATTLAIRAHISGVPRLSKGAIPVGGVLVKGGLQEKNGLLHPDERFSGKIKVDIRSMTRYMKILILSLEAHQLIYECDQTNNSKAIELK